MNVLIRLKFESVYSRGLSPRNDQNLWDIVDETV